MLVGATGRPCLLWHHVPGSLLSMRAPFLLPGGTGWLGPSTGGTPLVCSHPGWLLVKIDIHPTWVYLGTSWPGPWFPMVGSCQGSWCHEDWDLLHLWLWEHWELLEWCQLVEWLNCSICSSSNAAATRAHQCASLMMAIISSYESWCAAVNFSYVLQFAVANAVWGPYWGVSANNCACSPSGCVDTHLCQTCFLMESRVSLHMCSSIASLHWPLLGSLQNWYTSQYRSSMSWHVESGAISSMVVGSDSRSHLGNGSLCLWQMVWSCSLWLVVVAWGKICWHRYSWWRLLCAQCHCSLR